MASLNLIVGFDAVIQDASVGVSDFGIVGIFCYHSLTSVVRSYEPSSDGQAAMIADGFTVNDFAYKALSAIMAQDRKPKLVRVYKRAAQNVQALTLTPATLTQGVVYTFKVNDVSVSRANGVSETATTWATAWQSILTGGSITGVNVTSTSNTTFLTLTQTVSTSRRIYLDEVPSYLTLKDTSPDAGIATALNQGVADNSDFYGVIIDGQSEAELNAAAAWCESNKRIFHGLTVDSDVLTNSTTDVGSDFFAAKYSYSNVLYTRNPSKLPNAALMGRQFAFSPGESNWNNKTLKSVIADNLTGSEITNAKAKNVGLFLPFGTLNLTHNIKAGSGRFFDITRNRDWFASNEQAAILAGLARRETTPANQFGIDMIESDVRVYFIEAERKGVLDPGWKLTLPKASALPTLKSTRRLNANNAFFGYFQGSIDGADVSGYLAA
jgi:hypothetical protein